MNKFRLEISRSFLAIRGVSFWNSLSLEGVGANNLTSFWGDFGKLWWDYLTGLPARARTGLMISSRIIL